MEWKSGGESGAGGTGNSTQNPVDEAAQRKRLFSIVAAVGIAGITIGAVMIYTSISSPFPKLSTGTLSTNVIVDSVALLKNRDTDGDDLTDYREAYETKTSPFLRDSDSDGVDDGTEVKNGTDPNCPDTITKTPCGPVPTNTNSGFTNPRAAAIRAALKQSGAPANVIDKLDDATILSQYASATLGVDVNENVNDAATDINNLNATQLRALLESNGVDAATLSTVDDATLMTLYQDALTNTNS